MKYLKTQNHPTAKEGLFRACILIFILLEFHIYKIIDRVPSRACNIKDDKKYKINQRKLAIWEHSIMYIKESNCHSCYHRYHGNPDKKARDQKKRASELCENCNHQGHVTAKTEDTWKRIREFIEINHLIQSMCKEQKTEEYSKCKNE